MTDQADGSSGSVRNVAATERYQQSHGTGASEMPLFTITGMILWGVILLYFPPGPWWGIILPIAGMIIDAALAPRSAKFL